VQRLHIQLFIALDRNEPHRGSSHGFRDGFGIDVVVLVRLPVGLDVLRGNQANLVALLAQPATEEMGAPTSLHANESDAQVTGEPRSCVRDNRLRTRRRSMELDTIGIDLGKTVFHLVGLNGAGEVVSHLLYPNGEEAADHSISCL
jgi:hypothetical protein